MASIYWRLQLLVCVVALPVFVIEGERLLAMVMALGILASVWIRRRAASPASRTR